MFSKKTSFLFALAFLKSLVIINLMNILFLHRNFPGQFKYLAADLAKDKNNNVCFVTNNISAKPSEGLKVFKYKLKREVPDDCHRYLRFYEESIIHGQGAAIVLLKLKNSGFEPDVIYGHTWGTTLFAKDIFPKAKLVCYFEWYYNAENSDVDFVGGLKNVDEQAKLRCKNSHLLLDLVNCNVGVSPSNWQKSQFPKEFLHKIKVIPDGVDTNLCVPDCNAEFFMKDKNLTLTAKDEILTYATRGMEEYRGFPEFMQMLSKLQKIRPNMHAIIGGNDRVCYGTHLKGDSFKAKMLRELDFDMERIHFTGYLSYNEYLKLLQISTVHVYLTYPFVLSWSLLEAMACGCLIVASDTAPVQEVIQNNFSGLLVDFYNIDKFCENVCRIMDDKNKYQYLGKNARDFILKNYNLPDCLLQQKKILYDSINLVCKS